MKTIKSLNLDKIKKLYAILDSSIVRDISNQQVAILAKKVVLGKDFYQKDFHLSNDFFEVPDYTNYDGKYVLVPKDETFEQVHIYVQCILEKEDEAKCNPLKDK